MLDIAWKNIKWKVMCLCFASLSHFAFFSRSLSVSSFFCDYDKLVSVVMRSNVMDDLMKVISRLVAFQRFCCSWKEMANVADRHAWFSMNCRLVAGMPAETLQRPSGVAFSWPRILIVCSGTIHIRSGAMKTSRMLFLTWFGRRVSAEDISRRWSHDQILIR